MKKTKERRIEQRLRYELPVWFALLEIPETGTMTEKERFLTGFAEDFNVALSQGVMVDISSRGMAFICNADGNCPYPGQQLTTRFSIPRFGTNCSDIQNLTRTGRVCWIDNLSSSQCRVAIQFDEPPPFWDMLPRSNS